MTNKTETLTILEATKTLMALGHQASADSFIQLAGGNKKYAAALFVGATAAGYYLNIATYKQLDRWGYKKTAKAFKFLTTLSFAINAPMACDVTRRILKK